MGLSEKKKVILFELHVSTLASFTYRMVPIWPSFC